MRVEPKAVNQGFEILIQKIRSQFAEYERTQVKIGILGRTGTGKSTFINTLAGEEISPTSGIAECTGKDENGKKDSKFQPREFSTGGLTFVDLPGFGTESFPSETFMRDFKIKESFDCVILMTQMRLEASDKQIYQAIKKSNIPCFVVWTKFDETLRRAPKNGEPKDPIELSNLIFKNLKRDLEDESLNAFVISDEPHLFDFARLKEAIEKSLPQIKKDKFIESVAAQTEGDLKKKRAVAERIVGWMSAIAAAGSAIPDPTVVGGAAVDVVVLYDMANRIVKAYGLDDGHLDFSDRVSGTQLKTVIAKQVATFASREAILLILSRIAGRMTLKAVAKWIPFVGSIVAATIGYKMTSSFGDEVIDHCETIARKSMGEIAKQFSA